MTMHSVGFSRGRLDRLVARVSRVARRSFLSRRSATLRSLSWQQWLWAGEALTVVPRVERSLRKHGFKVTAARLAARSDSVASAAFVSYPQMAKSVRLVANRPVIGAVCLGRSLTLWSMLRRRGVDAQLVIGAGLIADQELSAHAWVEVDGVPVNDVADVRERYGSFDIALPRLRQP